MSSRSRATVTALAVVAILGLAVCVAGTVQVTAERRAAEVEHSATVRQWLASDYGIAITADHAHSLIRGSVLIVDYLGEETRITVTDAGRSRLSVVDENARPLEIIR